MTGGRHLRGLERIDSALVDLRRDVEMWADRAALARIETGVRRWSDFTRFADAAMVDEWREAVMAQLPTAIRRTRLSGEMDPSPERTVVELVAHVPDEPLSEECRRLIERSRTGWRAEDRDDALLWARIRIALGPDEGRGLRGRSWDRQGAGWQLSRRAREAVHRRGSSQDAAMLAFLTEPYVDADGQLLPPPTVCPGGRLVVDAT